MRLFQIVDVRLGWVGLSWGSSEAELEKLIEAGPAAQGQLGTLVE